MKTSREKRVVRILSVVLGALLTVGCHHGDGHTLIFDIDIPTAPSGNAKIEGTWDASIIYESGRRTTGVMILDQSHPFDWEVIGTLTVEDSSSDLVGTIAGLHLNLTATLRYPCSRSLELSAVVDPSGRVLDGSMAGENCSGDIAATFSATKR